MNGLPGVFLALLLLCLAGGARAGETPGLSATYYDNINFTGATVSRIDTTLNFDWGGGSPDPSIGADTFSARWTGSVLIPATGAYTFYTQSDDGVRLWLDCNGDGSFQPAEQLIDNWTNHGSTENSGACPAALTAGDRLKIQVDYYENGGSAVAQLRWAGPSIAKSIIPAGDGTRGLYSGVADVTPPAVSGASSICGLPARVSVRFSEAVSPATANNPANYALSGGIGVTGASLGSDGVTVTLSLSAPLVAGTSYTLTLGGIGDMALPPNLMAPGTTATFTATGGGFQPGLLGTYYSQGGVSGAFFTGTTQTRIDTTVDFDWGTGAPVTGIGVDNFSVRWTGYVLAPISGNYSFRSVSDDGVRLWVNGVQLIANWTDHGPTNDTSGTVALIAGEYYPVQMEYYERGGGAVARLQWQKPGDPGFAAIPATSLFTCDTTAPAIDSVSTVCGVNNSLTVVFSEPVEAVSGTTLANYSLSPAAAILGASLSPGGNAVTLTTSPLATAAPYTLTVRNVGDRTSPPNVIPPAGVSSVFSIASGALTAGIQGDYYGQGGVARAYFTGAQVQRIDPTIDFAWGGGSPIAGVGVDDFSVRWQGYVKASAATTRMRTRSDDGVRLWLGGSLVIDNWTDHGPTNDDSASLSLVPGAYYPLKMEFYERGGGADAHLLWDTGSGFSTVPASQLFYCGASAVPGGFNAFESSTAAGSLTGILKTKISGQAASFDVVALDTSKTAVDTGFSGDVKIELLDTSNDSGVLDANNCRSTWVPIAGFSPVTASIAAGRSTVSLTEANAWRNLRVRISYPASGAATAVGCSTDNFALRPASLGVLVSDSDPGTAGVTRLLNNLVLPGGVVHKAGAPFTLTVTAYNGAGTPVVTSNYDGSPASAVVTLNATTLPVSCLNGTSGCVVTPGTFTTGGSPGTVVSNTASYNEIGTFLLQLVDASYANVDTADSSAAEREIKNPTPMAVGRFVPDHFTVIPGAGITPACATTAPACGGSLPTETNFTYMNQGFATFAVSIEGRAAAETKTENYHTLAFPAGALASLLWRAEDSDNGTDLGARLSVPTASWVNGLQGVSGATFRRAAAGIADDPTGPYRSLQFGVTVVDPDGITLAGRDMNAAAVGCGAGCDAVKIGTTQRVCFGRLRLDNASGSEFSALVMPVAAQFWSGAGFVTHAADTCSTLTAAMLSLSNYQRNLNAGETTPVINGALGLNQAGYLRLTAPGSGNQGSVDLSVDLTSRPWFLGRWLSPPSNPDGDGNTLYDENPTARATFGVFRDRTIYRRENY